MYVYTECSICSGIQWLLLYWKQILLFVFFGAAYEAIPHIRNHDSDQIVHAGPLNKVWQRKGHGWDPQRSKSLRGRYENIIKKRLIFQPASGNQCFLWRAGGGAPGEGRVWGQRLSADAWFMICSVLHVCSQVSGSCTQLEQRGGGGGGGWTEGGAGRRGGFQVCFGEDKLKAWRVYFCRSGLRSRWQPIKSRLLWSAKLKVCQTVTVPDKWEEESERKAKCL